MHSCTFYFPNYFIYNYLFYQNWVHMIAYTQRNLLYNDLKVIFKSVHLYTFYFRNYFRACLWKRSLFINLCEERLAMLYRTHQGVLYGLLTYTTSSTFMLQTLIWHAFYAEFLFNLSCVFTLCFILVCDAFYTEFGFNLSCVLYGV